MSISRTVLVVEDDAAIRRGLADALRFGGYSVLEAGDGRAGLATAISAELEMVLLDVMLPDLDGFSLLAEIRRARPRLPVLMVTARGAEEDRVRGLLNGADDYIVKPFSARELLARIEAVLRRSAERPCDVRTLDVGGRTLDFDRREVRFADGGREPLSDLESQLLRYLASSRTRAVSREELLRCVWGLDPRGVTTRTVDMHVARLREKLRDDAEHPAIVVTVRGKGYMLGGGGSAP